MEKPISDAVRRFVLTSIPTVPHLEALLLLWRLPGEEWTAEVIARRLFVSTDRAQSVLADLCSAGLLVCTDDAPVRYARCAGPPDLVQLVEAVDEAYTRRLRDITSLIHSNLDQKAARFAQAFIWEKK